MKVIGIEKLKHRFFIGFLSMILVGCETVENGQQQAPPLPPSEEVTPVVPPQPVERDLSLGPRPKTVPVERVGESEIPPAVQGAVSSASVSVERPNPEKGALAGITRAHTYALQAKGQRGLEWSDGLAQRASLQVKQMPDGMCAVSKETVLGAAGEAVYVEPSGLDSKGNARAVTLSVKKIVDRFMTAKEGAFSMGNAGASIIGCAMTQCSNHAQIVLCRLK